MIIIGILAAIAIPTFLNQRENAWRAAVKSDVKNAAIAAESWALNNGNGTYTGLTDAIVVGEVGNGSGDVAVTVDGRRHRHLRLPRGASTPRSLARSGTTRAAPAWSRPGAC